MNFQIYLRAILGLSLLSWAHCGVQAQSIFPPGGENKSYGLTSALTDTGPLPVLSNPARLLHNSSLIMPHHELAFARITQSYEHRDFDPVRVEVATPLFTLGATSAVEELGLSFGLILSPTGYGKQTIDGLPRRIAGTYEPIYVELESKSYDIGVGMGWAPSRIRHWRMGASVIYRSEHRKLHATQAGEDATLAELDAKNSFYIPVLGLSYDHPDLGSVGFSFTFPRKKSYRGSQMSAGSEDSTSPLFSSYDPGIYRLALAGEYNSFIAKLHINFQQWSKGRDAVREGLTSSASRSDLRDVWQKSLSLGYRFHPRAHALLSYAVLPSPWGEGVYDETTGRQVIGVDFGQADNVDRQVWGTGIVADLPYRWRVNISAMRSSGERELARSADKPGFYQSEVAVISAEATKAF